MQTDSRGIAFLEETDSISPFHTLINALMTSVSNAIGKLRPIANVSNSYKNWSRGQDDNFNPGIFVDVGGFDLTNTPAGLYRVSFDPVLISGTGQLGYIRVTANGTNIAPDKAIGITGDRKPMHVEGYYYHTGGQLVVRGYANATAALATVTAATSGNVAFQYTAN